MSDYHTWMREVREALMHKGQQVTKEVAMRGMSADQKRKASGKNFMTDDVVQWRSLAGGNLRVEVSYSWFMNAPLWGLTVFCVGELAQDGPEWDHALSDCYRDVASLASRVDELDRGGRERIAALVEAKA